MILERPVQRRVVQMRWLQVRPAQRRVVQKRGLQVRPVQKKVVQKRWLQVRPAQKKQLPKSRSDNSFRRGPSRSGRRASRRSEERRVGKGSGAQQTRNERYENRG